VSMFAILVVLILGLGLAVGLAFDTYTRLSRLKCEVEDLDRQVRNLRRDNEDVNNLLVSFAKELGYGWTIARWVPGHFDKTKDPK
jgi:hypothetical protein